MIVVRIAYVSLIMAVVQNTGMQWRYSPFHVGEPSIDFSLQTEDSCKWVGIFFSYPVLVEVIVFLKKTFQIQEL